MAKIILPEVKARILATVKAAAENGMSIKAAAREYGEGIAVNTIRDWFYERKRTPPPLQLAPMREDALAAKPKGRGNHRMKKTYEVYSDAVHFALMAEFQLERIRIDDPRRDEAIEIIEKWIQKAKKAKGGRKCRIK